MGLPHYFHHMKPCFVSDVSPPEYLGPKISREESLGLFIDILKAHGIEVYALFGTALGFVREGGLISYDSDADLGIMVSDLDRFKALRGVLYAAGFYVVACRDFFVSFRQAGCGFGIDVSPMMRISTLFLKLLGYKWLFGRVNYREDFFASPEVFDFEGRSVLLPGPSRRYLEMTYGPDWETPYEGRFSLPRPFVSRCLSRLFLNFDVPIQFSRIDELCVFKPWASWVLKRFFPNAGITKRFRHPE